MYSHTDHFDEHTLQLKDGGIPMTNGSSILAHRGFSSSYPENTMLAFEKALSLGIDGLEFDVQLTADEVPIVIHDATVDRTTDGHGLVSSMNYREIRQLNAAKNKPEHGFQAIPTLHEVLSQGHEMSPQALYNLEIKRYDANWRSLIDRSVFLVQQHQLQHQILFSSFHHECMMYLKTHYPNFHIGLLCDENVQETLYLAKQLQAYSIHLNYHRTSKELLSICHAKHIRTAIWTVDQPQDMQKFFRQHAHILITNLPDVALQVRNPVTETKRAQKN